MNAYKMEGGLGLEANVSVMFDTNTASDVGLFFFDDSKAPKKKLVDAAMNFILNTKAGFDYNFYTFENARDYYDGNNVDKIKGRLRNILKLDTIDREALIATGKGESTLTPAQLDVAADEKLHALYDPERRQDLVQRFLGMHDFFYVLLLKMIEIQYREESLKLKGKILNLVQFMHFDLSMTFEREMVVAANYFRNPGGLNIFNKFNGHHRPSVDEALALLKNMAWDLMLPRVMERFATAPQGGDFIIVNFLSFDAKMVKVFDVFSNKGMIFYGDDAQVIPIAEKSALDIIGDLIKDSSMCQIINGYFTPTASFLRDEARERGALLDITETKQAMEHEIKALFS